MLRDGDNNIVSISADYQLHYGPDAEIGALETDGFSLCSNGSLAHQLDTTWYFCSNGSNYNIFARNVSPANCVLAFQAVLGDIPVLGSPITSTASTVQNPTAPTSSASHSSASTRPTSSPGSATLSTGDKAAIGVAVPVGLLGVAVVLYLIWRRRKKTSSTSPRDTATEAEWEKPELQDDSYDSAIAGPVRKKPELEAKSSHISELPHHSVHHIDAHEIAATVPTSSEQSSSSATQVASDSQAAPSRTASKPARKPVLGPSTTRYQAAVEPSKAENHDELTEEYDTLISEIGVISKRKKALNSAAVTAGVRPEDLQGRRGAEYQQLAQREEGVRARMAEVQNALGTNEG